MIYDVYTLQELGKGNLVSIIFIFIHHIGSIVNIEKKTYLKIKKMNLTNRQYHHMQIRILLIVSFR